MFRFLKLGLENVQMDPLPLASYAPTHRAEHIAVDHSKKVSASAESNPFPICD